MTWFVLTRFMWVFFPSKISAVFFLETNCGHPSGHSFFHLLDRKQTFFKNGLGSLVQSLLTVTSTVSMSAG